MSQPHQPPLEIQSQHLSISTSAPHYGQRGGDYHLSHVCRKLSWFYVLFMRAMKSREWCSNKTIKALIAS
jgi:hypothetical protein